MKKKLFVKQNTKSHNKHIISKIKKSFFFTNRMLRKYFSFFNSYFSIFSYFCTSKFYYYEVKLQSKT